MHRTLAACLTTIALVGAGLVTAASAPGVAAQPPQAAEPAPRAAPLLTGFEKRDGASWTTQPEESRFLRALDAGSDRVAVSPIGRTAQDRPLRLVAVGDPAPGTAAQVKAGSSLLFICSQHGDEPSGREACLQLARDLAYDDSASTTRFLQRTTVLFVPTANPDGRAADTRENSNDFDVNRDHLVLETEEGRAMAEVIRDYAPDLVHDLHEFGEDPGVYDRQLIHLWPRNRNVDEAAHDLSVDLNQDYVDPQVQDAGYTTGIYGIWTDDNGDPIAQIAGDGDERILRNLAGLRNSLGILVEANQDPTTPEEETDEPAKNLRRVDSQLVSAHASLDFLRENRAEVAEQTAAAVERMTESGSTGDWILSFAGGDNELPSSDEIDTTPPCAYRLTAAQYDEVRRTLLLQGITSTPDGADRLVSLGQPARSVIPLLLDERATYHLVEGTPVDC